MNVWMQTVGWKQVGWPRKLYDEQYRDVRNEAAAYATSHLISESIGRNIYNAADDKLFDNNGKLIATRLTGYDDLDWQDAIERNGHRQEYNLSAAASGQNIMYIRP